MQCSLQTCIPNLILIWAWIQNHVNFLAKYIWSVVRCSVGISSPPESCGDLHQTCFSVFTATDRKILMILIEKFWWLRLRLCFGLSNFLKITVQLYHKLELWLICVLHKLAVTLQLDSRISSAYKIWITKIQPFSLIFELSISGSVWKCAGQEFFSNLVASYDQLCSVGASMRVGSHRVIPGQK
jgi:hypothetical protein